MYLSWLMKVSKLSLKYVLETAVNGKPTVVLASSEFDCQNGMFQTGSALSPRNGHEDR